jgi:hypothetical protein
MTGGNLLTHGIPLSTCMAIYRDGMTEEISGLPEVQLSILYLIQKEHGLTKITLSFYDDSLVQWLF